MAVVRTVHYMSGCHTALGIYLCVCVNVCVRAFLLFVILQHRVLANEHLNHQEEKYPIICYG